MDKLKQGVSEKQSLDLWLPVIALMLLAIPALGFTHEIPKPEQAEESLLDYSLSSEQTEDESGPSTIIYHWIGDRLDQVTVERSSGLREVYQNTDSRNNLWNADETELGHMQNIRQWRLGSW